MPHLLVLIECRHIAQNVHDPFIHRMLFGHLHFIAPNAMRPARLFPLRLRR